MWMNLNQQPWEVRITVPVSQMLKLRLGGVNNLCMIALQDRAERQILTPYLSCYIRIWSATGSSWEHAIILQGLLWWWKTLWPVFPSFRCGHVVAGELLFILSEEQTNKRPLKSKGKSMTPAWLVCWVGPVSWDKNPLSTCLCLLCGQTPLYYLMD